MDEGLKELFLRLPGLFGSVEQIRGAAELTGNPRALRAIGRLEEVHAILAERGLTDYVTYDLGMLSNYRYYTGIIFKAYTYGTGDYIVKGGRYDKLLMQFGKDAPAVGFVIVVDQLMAALSRQQIDVPVGTPGTVIFLSRSPGTGRLAGGAFPAAYLWRCSFSLRKAERTLEAYQDMVRRRGHHHFYTWTGRLDGTGLDMVKART